MVKPSTLEKTPDEKCRTLIELANELIATGKTPEKTYMRVVPYTLSPIREDLGLNPVKVVDNTAYYSLKDIEAIREEFLKRKNKPNPEL
ncbi:MAG: hypothetical protein Q8L29_02425 [archaeon]|nr:hypothetical protein [archaeon]